MKTYIMCQMGTLAIVSLQGIVYGIKKIAYHKNDDIGSLLQGINVNLIGRLSEFYSMLPEKGRETELTELLGIIDEAEDFTRASINGGQRSLATFESYFRFDEIVKRFWQESEDESEKLFFFRIWLWWNVSGILPLRPREFVLTPRNCLTVVN